MQKYYFFYNKAALTGIISDEKNTNAAEADTKGVDAALEAWRKGVEELLHAGRASEHRFRPEQWEAAYSLLLSCFRLEKAAGGVVRNGRGEFLTIRRFGSCDFPKGHVEEGESFPQTAVREVFEETGVTGLDIERELPLTYHIFIRDGRAVLKQTQWYAMRTDFGGALKPQVEEQIEKEEWISSEELRRRYADFYPSLQRMMDEGGILR